MLAMAVWAVGWLLGASRRTCAIWTIVLVTAYWLLAEPGPAITRSMIMGVLMCLAIWLRRPVRSANWLAAAAIILLVIQPTQLFDPGFQLSFVTLLALIHLEPRVRQACRYTIDKVLRRDDPLLQPEIQEMLNPPSQGRRCVNWFARKLGQAFVLSFSAWTVGSILGAYHFHQLAPWGWFNTVVITIPMTVVLLLGLLKVVVTPFFPWWLTAALGWPLEHLTNALIRIVHLLDGLPGSGLATPEMSTWLVVLLLTPLALWALAPWLRISTKWIAAAMLGCALVAAHNLRPLPAGDTLHVHVLSVGNGTACVIELPDGKTLIYDLGSRPPYDMQRWTVGPFLAHEHVRSIDAVILSHPQIDHFSGVADLADRVNVRTVLTAPHFLKPARPSKPANQLIADLKAKAIPWHTLTRGDRLPGTGQVIIEVLWPPPPEKLTLRDDNDSSLVLSISFAGKRVLLCGDTAAIAEQNLLKSGDLKADVLVLPHHGSVIRTTGDFIRTVDPSYCIRSTGQRDRDTTNGLPDLLAGRRYLNTADVGAVEIRISPNNISVTHYRH